MKDLFKKWGGDMTLSTPLSNSNPYQVSTKLGLQTTFFLNMHEILHKVGPYLARLTIY